MFVYSGVIEINPKGLGCSYSFVLLNMFWTYFLESPEDGSLEDLLPVLCCQTSRSCYKLGAGNGQGKLVHTPKEWYNNCSFSNSFLLFLVVVGRQDFIGIKYVIGQLPLFQPSLNW